MEDIVKIIINSIVWVITFAIAMEYFDSNRKGK